MADANSAVDNGVKLLGEVAFIPGTSYLLDGEIKTGALYAAIGVASKILLGPPAVLLVAADSFARSVTGQGLLDHFKNQIAPESASKEVKK
ncbi:MAG: hypothetical protein FJ147_01425 [Deltaproteobacteria bacterium]|nr:hypothetical protein [Deltaproteobacteria bacterium]